MAGGGAVSAVFRKLAQDVAQAGENIGKSISRFFEDTADRADDSVATTMAAEEANVRAANAIRPKAPDLPAGSDPGAGPAEGSGDNPVARMLRGETPPKYSITKSLLPKYKGEEIPGNSVWPGKTVQYLSESQRARFKLTVSDGKLYDARGRLFDTSDAQSLHTEDDPRAIFVMDHDGNIYASKSHVVGEFHHSSFLAGGDVAGAGELKVSNGILKLVSDGSGHYQPTLDMTRQVARELQSRGVPLDDVDVQLWAKS